VRADRALPILDRLRAFLALETASGFLLLAAALLALLLSNSPLAGLYVGLLEISFGISLGSYELIKPLLLWVNDGLMAIFFLLVGLEIKREILEGELSSPAQAALPVIAAIGGMAVPAAVYLFINRHSPETMAGWAIPSATDIAFALAVLSLLGSRVPSSLKVFLLALAIIDDLGAIIIIALFYSADLSALSLGLAAVALAGLWLLNRRGVMRLAPYMLLGIFLWLCVLKSGVHATLSGVAVALFVPLGKPDRKADSPLLRAEHGLHPWVGFCIMPLFAFANAGVALGGLTLSALTQPVTLGSALGLFLGKQVGVMLAVFLGVALGLCRRPMGANWGQVYGVAILTGIGFTMSLFIGSLAFPDPAMADEVRLGVLAGSAASAVMGYCVLRLTSAPRGKTP
jgi:Na+:H+ antiporter, NhaA family